MLDFDFNEDFGQAYAMGLRNLTGVVINVYQKKFCIELHLDYNDRQLAKTFGASWEPNLKAWILRTEKVEVVSELMLKIQEDEELSNALAVYNAGKSIPCYIESRLEKAIVKIYTLARSGLLPKKQQSETEQVTIIEPKKKAIPQEYKIGLLMSHDGIEGFSVKCPYSDWHIHTLKTIARWADGKAKWHPDKKIWELPLTFANLIKDPHYADSSTLLEFLGYFDFTDGAKPYFEDYLKTREAAIS